MAVGPIQNPQASQQGEFNVSRPQYDPNEAPAQGTPTNTTAGGDTVTITPEAGALQQEARAVENNTPPPSNPVNEQPSSADIAESGRQDRLVEDANQQQAVNSARNTETIREPQQQTIDLIA